MSRVKRRSRENISIRLQPSEGSLLAKIAKWLKTMSIEEKNKMVSELLVINCLPLAEAEAGANQEEIERYYWESEKWLHFYRFTLKERLNIQGQLHYLGEPQTSSSQTNSPIQEEEEVTGLRSQLIGEEKLKNVGSIFEGFD